MSFNWDINLTNLYLCRWANVNQLLLKTFFFHKSNVWNPTCVGNAEMDSSETPMETLVRINIHIRIKGINWITVCMYLDYCYCLFSSVHSISVSLKVSDIHLFSINPRPFLATYSRIQMMYMLLSNISYFPLQNKHHTIHLSTNIHIDIDLTWLDPSPV